MMFGFLLARAGAQVLVLEKHADFLRDFRGDTIHPSTLELMHEVGLADQFLKRPHQEVTRLHAQIGGTKITVADFTHLPTRSKFIAFMPQWDFLNFIEEQAKRYSNFQLKMQAEAVDLIEESGRVVGVRVNIPDGELEVRADLIVGADGRHSTVREKAGLKGVDLGAPIDVLWMRLSRHSDDGEQSLGRFDQGRILVMIDRGDYWQCAYVIPKGEYDEIRERGLPAFRENIAQAAPFLRDRLSELTDWSDIKLLTVMINRLIHWCRPGLLCIGDAAHAMSPVGGVGINLAIQDAVAAANILAGPLKQGRLAIDHLHQVQKRRELPTRVTQRFQVLIQNRVISRVLRSDRKLGLPFPLKLVRRWPFLRRIPARVIGIGVRPEHVRTPDASERRAASA
ncbi:MAG: FAD-dependent oxidoreductase [Acidobacteriaceae bacterium]|nr:FAD-dependent oxidoreductase [Acidobacteriaceae bacterium]MBV9780574.1 FAD-dependent oxidoreductase [Acidobacteriaceae bacterium]